MYLPADLLTDKPTYLLTYPHACLPATRLPAYLAAHTYIQTSVHTYAHTHVYRHMHTAYR